MKQNQRLKLVREYLGGKTARQVAKRNHCDKDTVLYWIKKFGYKPRDISLSISIGSGGKPNLKPNSEFLTILDGLLLGDGCIKRNTKFVSKIVFANKNEGFKNYVKKLLEDNGFKVCQYKMYGKYWYLESNPTIWLNNQRKRWYKDKKKIVPKDICLKPITVLLWYLGDGNLSKIRTKYKNKKYLTEIVRLYPCSFSDKEVNRLVKLLKENGIIAERKICKGKYQMIWIGAKNVKNFFSFIGKCSIKEMSYKWPPLQEIAFTIKQPIS